jgi:PAS domain S-box-containing protein
MTEPHSSSDETSAAQAARYLALVEHAPDAIVILDVGLGRFVTVNRAAEELFGRTRDELLRLGPDQVSPPAQPDGRVWAALLGY